ncbi:thiamine-phosphate kinase [Qipengyuania sp.]|uniref:thiamine-phosphate kinase n=1 Tax=Qipengyuania sp. TaxID=2004515 RepID=UPI003AF908DB
MNEGTFVSALRALADDPAARGLDDDAAVLEFGGESLVVTHDTLVQGVHVREDEDPADIAWKLVAVNLSDLAAKGAEPLGVLVSHMLGEGDERFVRGLGEILAAHDVPLLGGDTVRAEGRRSWGCTAIGRATHTPVPDRRGAQVGDAVYVTGVLGRAMLGLEDRGSGSANDFAYRRPQPLLAEGRMLAPVVTAMMDVSDGLLLDCWRLARASRCTIQLERDSIPVADPGRADDCMRWGDDYQLLFTAPADAALPVAAACIGRVENEGGDVLRLDDEIVSPEDGLGYQH